MIIIPERFASNQKVVRNNAVQGSGVVFAHSIYQFLLYAVYPFPTSE
jgi:hypothetical protein